MQLPIDVKALIDEMTDIEAARNTPLSVSVFIDEEAPADLAAHVRNAFASTMPSVRMTVAYLDDTFMPHPTDDVAIITAGESAVVGPAATAIRAVGVPVMVVTTLPTAVAQKAEELGHAIPEGDLVSPEIESVGEEPYVLDDEVRAALDDRMGRWIVAACHDKRLALAIAFPFVRRPLARDAVQTTSIQNVGIGLVPILPGADLPVMTLNQAKMVLQIAAAYGLAMDKDRFKELGACVGSAFVFRTLARELTEFLPILGWIIKPGIAYGGTAALGYAVIEYFEGGGDATGVAAVLERATEKGTKIVSKARSIAEDPSSLDIPGKVSNIVPIAREKAAKYAPVAADAITDLAKGAAAIASTISTQVAAR